MPQHDYASCTVIVTALSKKACLCAFDPPYVPKTVEHWVPYSQIDNPEDVDRNATSCDLEISRWWLSQNDIDVK
jgi:hypothetical protein